MVRRVGKVRIEGIDGGGVGEGGGWGEVEMGEGGGGEDW